MSERDARTAKFTINDVDGIVQYHVTMDGEGDIHIEDVTRSPQAAMEFTREQYHALEDGRLDALRFIDADMDRPDPEEATDDDA